MRNRKRATYMRHETLHHDSGSPQTRSSQNYDTATNFRKENSSAKNAKGRRVEISLVDGPRHNEVPQSIKGVPHQFEKQVKTRSIDPNLKEFIDNAIVPILVKEYLVVEQIVAKVLDRLNADRKGKP